jgi:hypothetical protein
MQCSNLIVHPANSVVASLEAMCVSFARRDVIASAARIRLSPVYARCGVLIVVYVYNACFIVHRTWDAIAPRGLPHARSVPLGMPTPLVNYHVIFYKGRMMKGRMICLNTV